MIIRLEKGGVIMNKIKRFLHVLSLFAIIIGLNFQAFNVSAASSGTSDNVDKQQIENTINNYFEARYQSFKNLKLNNFDMMIANVSQNKDMQQELDKLDLEVYHASVFQLGYRDYKYYLNFDDITIDFTNETAKAAVIEGSDVVFEISAPLVSNMRNMNHAINLEKENGVWKIKSDKYEDYLWRLIKTTKLSKSDLHTSITEAAKLFANQRAIENQNPTPSLPSSPGPMYATYPYDRTGARDYAQAWYNGRNPDYANFGNFDCTNFVNQAIYLGGGAMMVGSGTIGWYYYNVNDRSTSWAGVPQLYEFLVPNNYLYNQGPHGVAYSLSQVSQLQMGDIIQYDWAENGGGFDHSVIVVGVDNGIPYIAAHSDNLYWYPYTYYSYFHTIQGYHFIHIDYLKGTPYP